MVVALLQRLRELAVDPNHDRMAGQEGAVQDALLLVGYAPV